jgi:phospholipase/carboxylesterase
MTLETIEIETAPQPAASVIWMHGLGADANDFVPLVPEINLRGALPVRFVFPNAPMIPVTINGGYVMRAWYDILAPNLTMGEDEAGLRRSQAAIEELIEREKKRGIPAARIVLAGFSQGCAMTLLTGLRYPQRLAGLLGLSGYVPLSGTTAAEASPANQDVPIFLAHGRVDPVIPLARALESRSRLEQLGYPIEWHEYAMPHSVCPQEIADLGAWMRRVLAA